MDGETGWGGFLVRYISPVWDYAWAIVPGLFFSAVDIVERWRNKAIPIPLRKLLWIFAGCFMIAQLLAAHSLFKAQEGEYRTLEKAHNDLDKKYKELYAQMNGLHGQFGTIELMSEPRTGIGILLVNIAVTNTGSPTVAQGFNLRLTYNGNVYPTKDGYYHPEYAPPIGILAVDSSGRPEMRLTGEDLIFEKTKTPIPSGGYANGWAFYRLDGLKADDFTDGIMVVDVAFHDVYGNMYHALQVSKRNPSARLPGSFLPGSAGPFEHTPRVPKGAILVPAEPRKQK